MAPDYTFSYTGPAHHNFDGSFVTHFIFTAFLLLFTIPIWVQVVVTDYVFIDGSVFCSKIYTAFSKWSLPVGSRVPPIAEISMPIAENCTKTQPATGANFTTAR